MHGILIFAHGARDPAWAEPFVIIRDQLRAVSPGVRVELAFLELMTPALIETAESMVQSGIQSLTVVPLFMARGSHLKEDLPRLIQAFSETHPGVTVTLTPAIGEVPELLEAIVGWIARTSAP